MPWIKVHNTIRENRKIMKVAELLSVNEPAVIGHLVLLWLWAIENARNGNLDVDARTIARVCGYKRPPQRLVDALVEARLLIRQEDGTLTIVNFDEHISPILVASNRSRARQADLRRRRNEFGSRAEVDVRVT